MRNPRIAAGFCTLLLAAPFARGADTKTAKIEEIFQLTKMDQMQKQGLEQARGMLASQAMQSVPEADREHAREIQDKILELVGRKMSWDKMKPAYIQIYEETFTAEELDGILGFYKSPAGRSMLEKMPQVMAKSMMIAQEQMKDIMPEVMKLVEELKRKQ